MSDSPYVCGYCRAGFDTHEALIRHDTESHGRRSRLLDWRSQLENMYGRGPVYDGRVRDMIADVDRDLAALDGKD